MLTAIDVSSGRILIVDDQAANVQLLERLLGDAGYTNVSSTLQLRDVEALYREHRYDLILLDLQMPAMDGFELIERLWLVDTAGYLPVIVLTAQPAHKLRALQSGAKDFINKPFDLVEVTTRIHNMLEVRLLYKTLASYNELLEQTVRERTADLRESEDRYRRLTELASDWYWEQDENGTMTSVSGPALEMLGIEIGAMLGDQQPVRQSGWNPNERQVLQDLIESRQPFLDLVISREKEDGLRQSFRVSGEPMFNAASRFVGYRGIGVEFSPVSSAPVAASVV